MNKTEFITALYSKGIFKTGTFTLKSGIISPFYINLREIISYPELLNAAAVLINESIPKNFQYSRIAGVPYSGIPIASALSLLSEKPLIIKRKEEKSYGSKDSVIGFFENSDSVLIVEDLITTGESILETKEELETAGLKVIGASVIIDRSFDKGLSLGKTGINLFKVTDIFEITELLSSAGLMDAAEKEKILNFISIPVLKNSTDLPERNAATEKLKQVIQEKGSNLILSLDVNYSDEFFKILSKAAPYICMLKTHVDILNDFSETFVKKLSALASENNFLIFEDRKFADIGNTVRQQYREGIYKIADWADFVTVHGIVGEGIIKGLFEGLEKRSGFLLAKMSAKDNLISENYTRKVLEMGKKNSRYISGFIGHGKTVSEIQRLKNKIGKDMLLLMPGVQINSEGDNLGQQYITPEIAVNGGADAIIVGRGITHSANIEISAKEYRDRAMKGV